MITFAWRIVSTFLDPGTVFKIRLVNNFNDASLLEDFTAPRIRDLEQSTVIAQGQPIPPLPKEAGAPAQALAALSPSSSPTNGNSGVSPNSHGNARSPRLDSLGSDDDLATSFHSAQGRESTEHDGGVDAAGAGIRGAGAAAGAGAAGCNAVAAAATSTSGVVASLGGATDGRAPVSHDMPAGNQATSSGAAASASTVIEIDTCSSSSSSGISSDNQRRTSPVPGMNVETLAKLRETVRNADRAAGGEWQDGNDDDDDDEHGDNEQNNGNGGNGGSDRLLRPASPPTIPMTDALVAPPATVAAVQDTLEAFMRAQGNPSVKALPEEVDPTATTTTKEPPHQEKLGELSEGLHASTTNADTVAGASSPLPTPLPSPLPPAALEEVCLREGDLFKRGKRSGLWSSRRCVLLTDAAANGVTGNEGAIARGSSTARGPRLAVRKGSGPAEDLLKGQRLLWLRGGHVAMGKSGPYFTVEVSAGPSGKNGSFTGNGSSGNGANDDAVQVPPFSAGEDGSSGGAADFSARNFSHRSSSGSNLTHRTSTVTGTSSSSTASSGEVDTFVALGSKVQGEAEAWAKALEDCLAADAHALQAAQDDVDQRTKMAQAAAAQSVEAKAAQKACAVAASKAQAKTSVKGQVAAAAHAATVAALQAPLGSSTLNSNSNSNSSGNKQSGSNGSDSNGNPTAAAYTAELAAEVLLLRNWQRAASAVATRKDNAFHDLLLAHLDALAELRNASDALNAAAAEATAAATAAAAASAAANSSSNNTNSSQAVQQSPSADAAARYVRSLRPAGASANAPTNSAATKSASQAVQQQHQQPPPRAAPSVPAAGAASSAATALAARAERTRRAYADAGEALAVHTGAEAERESVTQGPASGSDEGRSAEEQRLGKRARARSQWQASLVALRKRYTLGVRPLVSTPADAIAAANTARPAEATKERERKGSIATALETLASMWPRAALTTKNSNSAGAVNDFVAFPRAEEELLLAQREAAFDTSCRCAGAAEAEVRGARLALQSLGGRVAAQALELEALRAWHVAASSLADDKDAQFFAVDANAKALRSQVQQLGYTPREAPTSGFHFHTQANGPGSNNGRADSEARRSFSGLGHLPGLHQLAPAVAGLGAAGTRQLAGLAGHGAAGTLKLAGYLGQPLSQFNSRAPGGEGDASTLSSTTSSTSTQLQPQPEPPSPSSAPAASSPSTTPPLASPPAPLPPPSSASPSLSSSAEVSVVPSPPPAPPPALDAPARGAANASSRSATSSVSTSNNNTSNNNGPPKFRDRIGRLTRPFSKTSASPSLSSARAETTVPALQIPDRPSGLTSGSPTDSSSGSTAAPSPPPSSSSTSTLAGWRTGTVVLNGAKIWVSDARNPLTVVHALLDTARGVFAVARGADAAPAPLPLGPFRGAGNQSNGSNSELASLAAGGPSWGAAVRSVGASGFTAARSSAAFKELTLDAAELQRLDLSLLTRRATQTPSGSTSSSSSSSTPASSDTAAVSAPAKAAPAAVGPPPGPNAVESFYHAMVNLAVLHATIALEGPSLQDLTNPEGLAGKVGYNLGGNVVTIADLMSALKGAGLPPEPGSPTAYEF